MAQHAKKTIVYQQWLAGIGVTFLVLQTGFLSGWSSPTIARLTRPDSPIPLTPEQASWVASILNLGRLVGSFMGALSANYLGSKRSILTALSPIAIGWLTMALANSVEWLYIARISCGLGLGMIYSIFPIYIGEISMPNIRGALVSMSTSGAIVGQVISSVAGSYLTLDTSSSIYNSFAIALLIVFCFFPESPHHLVRVRDTKGAEKSIAWYRAGRGVEEELTAVENFVAASSTKTFTWKLNQFKTNSVKTATFHTVVLFSFMQICGVSSILFYMEIILIRAKFTLFNPSLVFVYVNLASLSTSIASTFLIDRYGRRFLMLISCAGLTISMLGLMTHFILLGFNVNIEKLQWLPLASMFVFMMAYCLGLFPVPSAILSEIFSADIKYIASCIANMASAVTSFLTTITYQPMVALMGEARVFLIYAILSAILLLYTVFLMPETKGKTLQQIQDELMNKKNDTRATHETSTTVITFL